MAELKDALVHREDADGWTGYGYPCPDCAVIFLHESALEMHSCPAAWCSRCGSNQLRFRFAGNWICGRCGGPLSE